MDRYNIRILKLHVLTKAAASYMLNSVVFVSPHPDDIAFSLAGMVSRLDVPATLLTVFGRSAYTRKRQGQATPDEISSLRREEDRRYAEVAGLHLVYHLLPSARLRHMASPSEWFAKGLDLPTILSTESIDLALTLPQILVDSAAPAFPTLLVLPAGLGGHRDHLLIRMIMGQFAREHDITTVYYEDLPYALRLQEDDIQDHMRQFRTRLTPVVLPLGSGVGRKRIALSNYTTQIDEDLIDRLTIDADRYGTPAERVWVPSGFRIDSLLS